MSQLDALDRKILTVLQAEGRISTLEVAERVGLSPTPCSRRIKRLEESGIIQGYQARINPAGLGLNICVIVAVKLSRQGPDGHGLFLSGIRNRPEITECLLVTGATDYMLRVWVKDIEALRDFITHRLQTIPSVAETSTMVVLNATKTAGLLPPERAGPR